MDRKSDRKLVSFRLPEDLLHDLRDRANKEDTSVTDLVCRLLRQGLQTNADDRIANLEKEIRDLRQSKTGSFSQVGYALLPQGLLAHENNVDIERRIEKLEELVEEKLEAIEKVLINQGSPRMQPKTSQKDSEADV